MYSFRSYFWNKNLNLKAFSGREQLTNLCLLNNRILSNIDSKTVFCHFTVNDFSEKYQHKNYKMNFMRTFCKGLG